MEFVEIGKVKKPHGLNGEIKLDIEDRYWDDFASKEVLFIERNGQKMPFFVEYVRGSGASIAKFEEIDSKEDALLIANKIAYLRREDVSLSDDEIAENPDLLYGFLKGFCLFDENLGKIGLVEDVIEYPQQEMAIVIYNESEVLIPLVKQWIVQIEKSEKKVYMMLPEGLMNL